ncbi:sugar ABC transporter substrate-binding protein [Alicyclobacillus acidoterrestris]|uniref:substrate-binding domain-containing protein n=1 Tax=Alicyclobacillus suci TaxID=2816080 RepID=UPI001195CA80|nr:substrate-binding domain-containing protein [Alicyclobacillus suci]GEO27542.1 sugar ABC transporter substrate-binding protein [Alicyclobacillus acidoterrestris]
MRFKNKYLLISASSIAMAIAVTGCGSASNGVNNDSGSNQGGASSKVSIGFVEVTESSPYYVELKDAIAAQAKKYGYTISYADAENDVSTENSDIMDMLTKGVKVIIVDAVNPQGIAPAVTSAKKDNVPVIAVDRPVSVPVTTFVGRDNQHMGELIGNYTKNTLLKNQNNKDIYEIQGSAGDLVMMARRSGFDSAFSNDHSVTIDHSSYDDYVRSQAITSLTDYLAQPRPDLSVVYAHNDDMGLGAYQVLQQQGLKNVDIVSIDGMMQTIKDIMDGTQYKATCLNDPAYQGTVAVEAANRIVTGKSVPKTIDVGTQLITQQNAKKYYNPSLAFASYTPPIKW